MNINTLGLCRKAGKLVYGFDAVIDELAKDLSPKTRKELDFRLTAMNVQIPVADMDADMDAVAKILGKRTGIILITDEGFWKSLNK